MIINYVKYSKICSQNMNIELKCAKTIISAKITKFLYDPKYSNSINIFQLSLDFLNAISRKSIQIEIDRFYNNIYDKSVLKKKSNETIVISLIDYCQKP